MKKVKPKKPESNSMTRDVLYSLALHLAIVTATVVSAPFEIKKKRSYDEIIRVSLTSLPPTIPSQAPEPIAIPQALSDVLPEIPIDAPTTAKEAVIKPKPKKEKNKKNQPKTTGQVASQGNEKEIESPATGSGSPFQGATIDNVSFNYPYWFTQAFNKIAGNWRNPVPYEGTLVCAIYFQVIRSGRVVELRVETSSGIPAFDKACLLSIERSAPFPPLPREFRDEIIGITVPFKNR
jgi:protein TonB